MKNYEFSRGNWEKDDFILCCSRRNQPGAEFTQEAEAICNQPSGKDFQYISMVTKDRLPAGTEIETRCSFDAFGAPLLVISDDLSREDSVTWYGLHFEIVCYEGGLNVWQIEPGQTGAITGLLKEKFPVTAGERHLLKARILEDRLEISLDGREMVCPGAFPAQFHAGVTACEGINHFFTFHARKAGI